jgi:outer membrane protein assembly factor BamB
MSAYTPPLETNSPPPKPIKYVEERKPRIWLPLSMVVLFWTFYYVGSRLDFDLGTVFFSRVGASGLVLIVGSVWWWGNGRIPLRDRVLGCLVFVAGLVLVPAVFAHRSIDGFGMYLMGIPVVLSAAALGLIAGRDASHAGRRLLVNGAMIAAFVGFSLVRMDGVAGNGDTAYSWRWSPTKEDQFLAQQKSQPTTPIPSPASEKIEAQPGDWVEFRGGERQCAVTAGEITTDWRTTPPKLVWKKAVGPAWSSVIVVAGKLFTQEQRGQQEAVVCYDTDTGNELWAREYAARYEDTVAGAGPRSTPTFHDGRIYAMGAAAELICVDAATGEKLWSQDARAESKGEQQMWGFASSPLVTDGVAIVFAGGKEKKSLLAYRIDGNHEVAWRAAGGTMSYSSPQLAQVAGQRVVLFVSDAGLLALDPESGKQVWQAGDANANAPHSLQPHVWSSGPEGEHLLINSAKGVTELSVSAGEGKPMFESGWLSKDLKPDFNDFVIYQGHAYGFDREIFACIDLKTGKRTWKGGRYGHGQVILLEDHGLLIVIGEKGQCALVAADPKKHTELGKFQALTGKTWNHPVVVAGRLYARNAEEMACYDLRPAAGVASAK